MATRDDDALDAQPGGAKNSRLGRTHDRILGAYGEVLSGAPADRVLRTTFKRARDLGPRERAEVSDVVYGLVRSQRTIDDRLDRGLKAEGKKRELLDAPIVTRLRVLTYLALNGAGLEALAELDPYAFKRIPKLFPRIVSGKLPAAKRTAAEELAINYSLPDFVAARLIERLGAERTQAIGAALLGRSPITIRVHRGRATRDEIRASIEREHGILVTPTMISPDGLILAEHADLASWPEFEQGLIEPQDEGSQLLALATGAAPKELVLDACAGAGGKTLALSAMMGGSGRLVALDPDPKKLEELKLRARRAQITNIEAVTGDLQSLPDKMRGVFDRVLVDAPCSGSGSWRRHPDARWRVREPELAEHHARQQRLIAGALTALKPGGLLIYATCSVLAEENEDVINGVHATDSRLVPVRLTTTLGALASKLALSEHGDQARIGPGPSDRDPDGFFVALMQSPSL